MKKILSILLFAGTVAVYAGLQEIPLEDISCADIKTMRARSEVFGSCSTETEQKNLSFYFDFTGCSDNGNSYIRFEFEKKLANKPEKLLWNINIGKGTENVLINAWFQDRSGEIYLSKKKADWTGWKKVEFIIPSRPAWSSGDKNGTIDLPLSLMGIGFERTEKQQQGTVLLGSGSVITEIDQGSPFIMNAEIPQYIWGDTPVNAVIKIRSFSKINPEGITASITLKDRYYDLKPIVCSVKIAKDGTGILPLPINFGSYEFKLELTKSGKLLDESKGVIQHFKGDCSMMPPEILEYEKIWSPTGGVWGSMSAEFASRFGARWDRFETPNWRSIETSPQKYDTSELVKKATEEIKNYTRPIVLQTLYAYPKFRNPKDLPDFSHGYGQLMRQTAMALKPFTAYFELGNEDNGHSKFIYTETARNGAAAVRSMQPFAVIANSGTAFIDNNWLTFQTGRGLADYLDAFCVHPYTNNSTPSQQVSAEKMLTLEKLEALNHQVDKAGGMKELWSTEFGWPNAAAVEKERASLYPRQMIVCEAAGLTINGIYTFKRDYGVVDYPAGPAVNAFNFFRAGHRFAGLIVEEQIWIAVYEKSGEAFAVVWTPEAKTTKLTITGKEVFDMFGNQLSSSTAMVSQTPIFVTGIKRELLEKAVSQNAAKKKKFFQNCLNMAPADPFWNKLTAIKASDTAGLQTALLDWTKQAGKIDVRTKALAGRAIDWYLASSRLTSRPLPEKCDSDRKKAELKQQIITHNRQDQDLPGLRHLLNRWERISAEKQLALNSNKLEYAAACATEEQVIAQIATCFARNEMPFQFAVFSMLYMKKGNDMQEHITVVPGEFTTIQARVSSYSAAPHTVTIRPVPPTGWSVEPASAKVELGSNSCTFVDFRIKAPVNENNRQPQIKLITAIEGKTDNITIIDDLEIVPAVKLEIHPVAYDLNHNPLQIEVVNQEAKNIGGTVRLLQPGKAGESLAQFTFTNLKPFTKQTFPVKLTKIPKSLHPDWMLNAEMILNDGRRFVIPAKTDFTVAVKAKEEPRIDAILNEWSTALPLKLDRDEYSYGSFGSGWSPDDCSAVSYLMWDDKNLYFAAVVRDQTFNQQYDRDSMWKQDSIQLIFAADRQTKPRELTLALSPNGPRIWDNAAVNYLKNGKIAIVYNDKQCIYEAAIPWSSFDKQFAETVKSGKFRYGIAVNDDDAITSRHYMERFPGSIVHGKNVESFAEAMLAGSEEEIKVTNTPANEIMKDDFNNETAGTIPLAWKYHHNNLPANAVTIVAKEGLNQTAALKLVNKTGKKANHFAIITLPLTGLKPNIKYQLEFRVKGNITANETTVGLCSDDLGNQDYTYAKWTPSNEWQHVVKSFTAPVSGNYKVLIRNVEMTEGLLIDDISVTMQKQ